SDPGSTLGPRLGPHQLLDFIDQITCLAGVGLANGGIDVASLLRLQVRRHGVPDECRAPELLRFWIAIDSAQKVSVQRHLYRLCGHVQYIPHRSGNSELRRAASAWCR